MVRQFIVLECGWEFACVAIAELRQLHRRQSNQSAYTAAFIEPRMPILFWPEHENAYVSLLVNPNPTKKYSLKSGFNSHSADKMPIELSENATET